MFLHSFTVFTDKSGFLSYCFTDPHALLNNDSEWDSSDSDTESELSDSESDNNSVEELDEPLATYARHQQDCNAPSNSFVWRKKENVPQYFDFSASPGVKVPDLDKTSWPYEIFNKFLTEELLEKIAEETNW